MIDTFFKEELHYGNELNGLAFSAYKAGVAAYVFLESPASDKWKREHGFLVNENQNELLHSRKQRESR